MNINKKKYLFFLKLIILTIILYTLISYSYLKPQLLIKIFEHPLQLLSTILLFIFMVFLSTWRWKKLNDVQHIHLSFAETFRATYIGIGFNTVLPGGVGGDFYRLFLLFKLRPEQKGLISLSIFFDRLMGFIGIFVTIFLINLYSTHLNNTAVNYFIAFSTQISFALIILLISLILFPAEMGITHFLKKKMANNKLIQKIVLLLDILRIYRKDKKVIFLSLVISIAIQLSMVITILSIAILLDFPLLDWKSYAMALGITQVANLIPASPGGIGIGEAAFSNTLSAYYPRLFLPFATIFLAYRIIGLLSYLPGICYYFLFINRYKNLTTPSITLPLRHS